MKKSKRPIRSPGKLGTGKRTLQVVAQGYGDSGASYTKRGLKGFTARSGSPYCDIDDHNRTLRSRSRSLAMGDPLATSAIRTVRTNVVGVGLVPKSTIDASVLGMGSEEAAEWQRRAEREFALWAEDRRSCDSSGLNNFYEMQQLALTSYLTSGDVFALVKHARREPSRHPYGLRIQLIEADRVANPLDASAVAAPSLTRMRLADGHWLHDGVEVDADGNVVAYHIRNGYPDDILPTPATFTRVPAIGARTGLPNVLHVMESERPEQYRGVPYLAQVIEPLVQMKRYTEAELVAAVVEAMFTVFIKTDAPTDEYPFEEQVPEGERPVSRDPDEIEMGPGAVNVLEPGEDIVAADPKRPASGYESFIRTNAELIGAALEIPADLLMKSFDASYSASRAALLEAWKGFSMRRQWFVDDFCAPIWEIWMSEAVALGRIDAPGFFSDPVIRRAYLSCDWIGPSQGQLDPTKEIQAEIAAIGEGLTTRHAAARRLNGSSWDTNMDLLAYEQGRIDEVRPSTRTAPTERTSIEEGTDDAAQS